MSDRPDDRTVYLVADYEGEEHTIIGHGKAVPPVTETAPVVSVTHYVPPPETHDEPRFEPIHELPYEPPFYAQPFSSGHDDEPEPSSRPRRPILTHALTALLTATVTLAIFAAASDAFSEPPYKGLPETGTVATLGLHTFVKVLNADGIVAPAIPSRPMPPGVYGPSADPGRPAVDYNRGSECQLYPGTKAKVVGEFGQRVLVRTASTGLRPGECPAQTVFLLDGDEFRRTAGSDRVEEDSAVFVYRLR